jgi:hypothetical protein
VRKRPVGSSGRPSVSPRVPARPARPGVGRREIGGKPAAVDQSCGPIPRH